MPAIILIGLLEEYKSRLGDNKYQYFKMQGREAAEEINSDFPWDLKNKRTSFIEKYYSDNDYYKSYRVNYRGFDVLITDHKSKEINISISEDLFEL